MAVIAGGGIGGVGGVREDLCSAITVLYPFQRPLLSRPSPLQLGLLHSMAGVISDREGYQILLEEIDAGGFEWHGNVEGVEEEEEEGRKELGWGGIGGGDVGGGGAGSDPLFP